MLYVIYSSAQYISTLDIQSNQIIYFEVFPSITDYLNCSLSNNNFT